MKNFTKTKKLILAALVCVFALSLGIFSVTAARYVTERGNQGTIGYDSSNNLGDIDYGVLNKVEVTSQEDLFNALESGYPFITLSEKVNDPLIITQSTMDVKRSLTLDINGKEIQRVSENAMLRVGENVTLTIIDSSGEQKGKLYNPVGTVLEVNGGSLDVRAGKYESGPRTWEYYSSFKNNTDTNDKGIVGVNKVNMKRRGQAETTEDMPIINPVVTPKEGQLEAINGNIYYDIAYTNLGKTYIDADTYCFYITSDNFTAAETVQLNATDADFSYTYYAEPHSQTNKQYKYISNTRPSGTINEDFVLVTVYAFENDIQTAMGYPEGGATVGAINAEKAPQYAAIKMSSGNLAISCSADNSGLKAPEHNLDSANKLVETSPDLQYDAKSGSFISYFGVSSTSCVSFTGGTMSVDTTGAFSTVDPKTVHDINPKAFSSEGRGICIHGDSVSSQAVGAGSNGRLEILSGKFYSYNHNLVRVEAGEIRIDGKDTQSLQMFKTHRVRFYNGYDASSTSADISKLHQDGMGGVYSGGGKTFVGQARIMMTAGTLSANKTYESKQGVYGIYAVGGNVEAYDFNIRIRGQGCVGVYSLGGNVTIDGSAPTTITAQEKEAYYGSLSAESKADINNLYKSNIIVTGYNTKGVLVQKNGDMVGSVKANNTLITVSRALGQDLAKYFIVGVDVLGGNATFNNCQIQSDGYGIGMVDGDLAFNGSRLYSYNASAIILSGGSLAINEDTKEAEAFKNSEIKCNITKEYVDLAKNDDFVGLMSIENKIKLYTYAGIDILSGNLSVDSGSLDYIFNSDAETPELKDRIDPTSFGTIYQSEILKSTEGFLPAQSNAVRVNSGGSTTDNAFEIYGDCNITSNMGGGVLVRNGNVVMGKSGNGATQNTINISAKVSEADKKANNVSYNTFRSINGGNVGYFDNKRGGDAMFVSGGNVTVNTSNLTMSADHGNGLLVTGASCVIDEQTKKYTYKSEVTNPRVVINGGNITSNAQAYTDITGDGPQQTYNGRTFYYTSYTCFYAVKVVCGGEAEINGGNLVGAKGSGGICTMGGKASGTGTGANTSNDKNRAKLTLKGDYISKDRVVTAIGYRDTICCYDGSDVTITSNDNPNVRINSSGVVQSGDLSSNFGVSVSTTGQTVFATENMLAGSKVVYNIDGGYYKSAEEAFWSKYSNLELTISNGWFIGGTKGGLRMMSQATTLNLQGGKFICINGGQAIQEYSSAKITEEACYEIFVNKADDLCTFPNTTSGKNGTAYKSRIYFVKK